MIMNIAYTRFQTLTFDSLQPIYINAICICSVTTIKNKPAQIEFYEMDA